MHANKRPAGWAPPRAGSAALLKLRREGGALVGPVEDGWRVGRDPSCELLYPPNSLQVSKKHAELRRRGGRWTVRDLGSSNGTFVNGKRVSVSPPLFDGDRIRFGGDAGPVVEVVEELGLDDTLGEEVQGVPDTMQDLTPLPQVAPLPGEAEDPDGPAATLRRSLVRERERHVEARRELKSVSASARRRQAALFLLLLLVAAWGYFVFENKQPTEADLDALVSACRAHPGADPDPSLAASCEQLLSRLFDELTVACTAGEGAAVAPVEARCARVEQLAFTVARERAEGYRAEYQQAVAAVEQRRPGFDQALSAVLRRFGSAELQIDSLPPPFVEEIGRLLDELQAPASHSSLQRQLCRREGCFALFAPHFKRYGLPELYGYLAWQESGFRSGEESPAGAVGLWQLMVPTAEHYGLVVSEPGLPGSDERLEPAKATRAAARYLRDLRKIFRDSGLAAPLLVVAAYNSGQGRILQNQDALVPVLEAEGRDASERADFITLWLHEKLPRETLRYVPRILALAMIGESPEAFGFDSSRCARRGCG